jgi:hypothetical protein
MGAFGGNFSAAFRVFSKVKKTVPARDFFHQMPSCFKNPNLYARLVLEKKN